MNPTPNNEHHRYKHPSERKREAHSYHFVENKAPASINSNKKTTLREKFNGWRLGITLDAEDLIKVGVITVLIIVFTLLQTTLFTRFRPFGAIPDLMLPFIIALSVLEKEKWGSIVALIAAYVIDAAGGTTLTLLPLLYVPTAFLVGLLTTHRLRDSLSVNIVYTILTSLVRVGITFIIVMFTVNKITVADAFYDRVIPEFFANIVIAPFPQILTRLCLRPFHKTRAERTGKV